VHTATSGAGHGGVGAGASCPGGGRRPVGARGGGGWAYLSTSNLGVISALVTVRWARTQALPCPIGHFSAEGV
jgi:hypothetical protein